MENKITIVETTSPKAKQTVGKKILKKIVFWASFLIIILTPAVLVHELAHMLTALACGMTVETYNIGFGPSLFHFEAGGIVYHWRLVLLGGYVSIAESMYTFPVWQQLLVMFAGCAINLITFLLLAKIFMRNWWIWCKATWNMMVTEIGNIILKTFFLPGTRVQVISTDSIMNSKWTRLSKKKSTFVNAFAFISVNWGLFNLVPFVGVLDGGKITSIVLTPLLGATLVTKISTVLLQFVLHRWITWEYGLKKIINGIQGYMLFNSEKRIAQLLLDRQVVTQKQLDFMLTHPDHKLRLQYTFIILQDVGQEKAKEVIASSLYNRDYPNKEVVELELEKFTSSVLRKLHSPDYAIPEEDWSAITEAMSAHFRAHRLQVIMNET